MANSLPGRRPPKPEVGEVDETGPPTAELPIPKAGLRFLQIEAEGVKTVRSTSEPRCSLAGGSTQDTFTEEIDKGAESAPENNSRLSVSEPPKRPAKMCQAEKGKNFTMDTAASTPESSYRDGNVVPAS